MIVSKWWTSVGHAWKGILDVFRSQVNARIHLLAVVCVCLAGWYVGLSPLEWVAILGCIAWVIGLEMVNTAIEYLTDLVSPEFHPLAGKAKDAAAAAVLWSAFIAVVVGALIFIPKICAKWG